MAFLTYSGGSGKQRPLPRSIHLRRGGAEDEFATFEVMRRSMGYDMSWTQHVAMRHHLREAAGVSFWVAEETPRFSAAKVIGYARSVVRDHVWSLTEFFVLPGHHRQGIGGALLERCLTDGTVAGANTRLVLASHHPAADSLYIRKADCLPRLPMVLLAGPLSTLRLEAGRPAGIQDALVGGKPTSSIEPEAGAFANGVLTAEPISLTPTIVEELARLDRAVVGYARFQEHTFWAAEAGGVKGASRLFRRQKVDKQETAAAPEIVGYAYIGRVSSGPVLALDPADQPRMIAHVAALAQRSARMDGDAGFLQTTEQYWAVAGINEVVLRWLLECGWQIVFQYLFMSSRPLGQFDRYVCQNPLYVL